MSPGRSARCATTWRKLPASPRRTGTGVVLCIRCAYLNYLNISFEHIIIIHHWRHWPFKEALICQVHPGKCRVSVSFCVSLCPSNFFWLEWLAAYLVRRRVRTNLCWCRTGGWQRLKMFRDWQEGRNIHIYIYTLYQHRPQIAWKGISHVRSLLKRFKIYKFQPL